MRKTASRLGLLTAVLFLPVAVSPPAIAAQSPYLISMGPDPGGRSGEGVTPQTTTTDHPAVASPQTANPSSERGDASSKSDDNGTARHDDPSDRSHTVPLEEGTDQ
jgi:hypothetical protein